MAKHLDSDDDEVHGEAASGHNGAAPPPINGKQLVEDLDEAMGYREDVATANQEHGATLKAIAEYNMQAFKALMTLKKKSSDAQADYLRTFNAGIEALGLGTPAQGDLLANGADKANGKLTVKAVKAAAEDLRENGKIAGPILKAAGAAALAATNGIDPEKKKNARASSTRRREPAELT